LSVLLVSELKGPTASGKYADTVLQSIIDEAELEIQSWINLNGLTVPTTNFKAASHLLSKSGMYERMFFDGSLPEVPGESGARYRNLEKRSVDLRAAARNLIIPEIGINSSTKPLNHYIWKVNP